MKHFDQSRTLKRCVHACLYLLMAVTQIETAGAQEANALPVPRCDFAPSESRYFDGAGLAPSGLGHTHASDPAHSPAGNYSLGPGIDPSGSFIEPLREASIDSDSITYLHPVVLMSQAEPAQTHWTLWCEDSVRFVAVCDSGRAVVDISWRDLKRNSPEQTKPSDDGWRESANQLMWQTEDEMTLPDLRAIAVVDLEGIPTAVFTYCDPEPKIGIQTAWGFRRLGSNSVRAAHLLADDRNAAILLAGRHSRSECHGLALLTIDTLATCGRMIHTRLIDPDLFLNFRPTAACRSRLRADQLLQVEFWQIDLVPRPLQAEYTGIKQPDRVPAAPNGVEATAIGVVVMSLFRPDGCEWIQDSWEVHDFEHISLSRNRAPIAGVEEKNGVCERVHVYYNGNIIHTIDLTPQSM
ncbi:MAG: hypothetical protein ACTS3F_12360 [Phycisphaerales bacterium]